MNFESKSSRSSSSSGYDYPLDHEVQFQPEKPQRPNIPKLNFGANIDLKGGSPKKAVVEPSSWAPPQVAKIPNLGLNLENIKKKDFQDEFMDKFDEYSKSWRDMIEKERRF